jgi:hypothetical protein
VDDGTFRPLLAIRITARLYAAEQALLRAPPIASTAKATGKRDA